MHVDQFAPPVAGNRAVVWDESQGSCSDMENLKTKGAHYKTGAAFKGRANKEKMWSPGRPSSQGYIRYLPGKGRGQAYAAAGSILVLFLHCLLPAHKVSPL